MLTSDQAVHAVKVISSGYSLSDQFYDQIHKDREEILTMARDFRMSTDLTLSESIGCARASWLRSYVEECEDINVVRAIHELTHPGSNS